MVSPPPPPPPCSHLQMELPHSSSKNFLLHRRTDDRLATKYGTKALPKRIAMFVNFILHNNSLTRHESTHFCLSFSMSFLSLPSPSLSPPRALDYDCLRGMREATKKVPLLRKKSRQSLPTREKEGDFFPPLGWIGMSGKKREEGKRVKVLFLSLCPDSVGRKIKAISCSVGGGRDGGGGCLIIF